MVSDRVDEAGVVLGAAGVEAVGERIHRAVGQDADDPAAEVVGAVGRVAVGDDRDDVAGGVGRHADGRREPWTGTMIGVVGNGDTGVTVTYRPDARSLTKRVPP